MSEPGHRHPMALFRRAWSVPKDGNAEEENEDAFRIEDFKGDDGYQGLFIAISDGASGAIYSRSWAQSLVAAAKPEWPTIGDDSLTEQIQRVRKQFSPLGAAENVQWYVRTKFLTEGSQATLLLVTVKGWRETDSSAVHAVSVGDCCLLLFRHDGEVNSFPNSTSKEFGIDPVLLRSNLQCHLVYESRQFEMQLGDALLVCTDAVAKWALQCLESNRGSLVLEALVRLLTPRECDPGSSGTIAPVDAPSSSGSDSKFADAGAPQKGDANREQKPRWLARFFNSITQLFRDADSGKPLATPTPGSTQPPIQGQALGQPWEFKNFIEFYRAKEKSAHIRNDDTTLVLFVPVRCATDERLAALEILQQQLAVKQ